MSTFAEYTQAVPLLTEAGSIPPAGMATKLATGIYSTGDLKIMKAP